jgi:hypothetical protein
MEKSIDSESTPEESSNELCGVINHECWKEIGPFYTIILYPDFSYKVCACTDCFPEEPNLTRDGYKCIDWDFYNTFWVTHKYTVSGNNQISAECGMEFTYTDYHNFKHGYRHNIFPIESISSFYDTWKMKIRRLLNKGKFHREKNRNILAEYIGFEFRNDPWGENSFSKIENISEMPRIYGPVLIQSNTCWRTMGFKTCEKAIEFINSACKKYMVKKYMEHLETCGG